MKRVKNFILFYDKETDKMTLKFFVKGKVRIHSKKHFYIDCPCWTQYFDQGHPRVAICGYTTGLDIEDDQITIK